MNSPSSSEKTKEPSSSNVLRPWKFWVSSIIIPFVTAMATVCIAMNTTGWQKEANKIENKTNQLTLRVDQSMKTQRDIEESIRKSRELIDKLAKQDSETMTQLNEKLDIVTLTKALSNMIDYLTEGSKRITSTEEEPDQGSLEE